MHPDNPLTAVILALAISALTMGWARSADLDRKSTEAVGANTPQALNLDSIRESRDGSGHKVRPVESKHTEANRERKPLTPDGLRGRQAQSPRPNIKAPAPVAPHPGIPVRQNSGASIRPSAVGLNPAIKPSVPRVGSTQPVLNTFSGPRTTSGHNFHGTSQAPAVLGGPDSIAKNNSALNGTGLKHKP